MKIKLLQLLAVFIFSVIFYDDIRHILKFDDSSNYYVLKLFFDICLIYTIHLEMFLRTYNQITGQYDLLYQKNENYNKN